MTEYFKEAVDLEQKGDFQKAATYFAVDAFEDIVRSNVETGRTTRINLAILLRAISCDSISGNLNRATLLYQLVRHLVSEIKSSANEPILVGLAEEWQGDAKLMLSEGGAAEHYERAADVYDDVNSVQNWAVEEEVEYALWAFERFAKSQEWSLPEDFSHDFSRRIQFKIDVSTRD